MAVNVSRVSDLDERQYRAGRAFKKDRGENRITGGVKEYPRNEGLFYGKGGR